MLTSMLFYYFITNLDGHYFSANYQTAKYFALQKLGQLKRVDAALQKKGQVMTAEAGLFYPVFICRVRNVSTASYKYVINDEVSERFVTLLKLVMASIVMAEKCADI